MEQEPGESSPRVATYKTARERLAERGQWESYLDCVLEFKKLGKKETIARQMAIRKFLSDEELIEMGLSVEKKPVAPVVEEETVEEVEEDGRRDMPKARYVDMKVFKGKECSEVESIRWVGKVMGMFGVKASDCPSAAAWNLLNHCRSDPEFRKTFWSSMFVKAIRVEKEREGEGDEVDGGGVVKLCDRLLELSKSLKGAGDE